MTFLDWLNFLQNSTSKFKNFISHLILFYDNQNIIKTKPRVKNKKNLNPQYVKINSNRWSHPLFDIIINLFIVSFHWGEKIQKLRVCLAIFFKIWFLFFNLKTIFFKKQVLKNIFKWVYVFLLFLKTRKTNFYILSKNCSLFHFVF